MQLFLKNQNTKTMLMSSFNGKPAPGGVFSPITRTFCKRVGEKAFYWPEKAYPVDEPIVKKLKELECQTMLMVVIKKDDSCETFKVDFNTFLEKSTKINWPLRGDNRFPVRRYLSMDYWKCIENSQEWAGRYYDAKRLRDLYSQRSDYLAQEDFSNVPPIIF